MIKKPQKAQQQVDRNGEQQWWVEGSWHRRKLTARCTICAAMTIWTRANLGIDWDTRAEQSSLEKKLLFQEAAAKLQLSLFTPHENTEKQREKQPVQLFYCTVRKCSCGAYLQGSWTQPKCSILNTLLTMIGWSLWVNLIHAGLPIFTNFTITTCYIEERLQLFRNLTEDHTTPE